jgi:hypothetical membrane protein
MTSTISGLTGGRARAAGANRRLAVAGVLFVVAAAVVLMGIISAEALHPGPYTTGGNEISDLGGTRPPDSIVYQPTATIFNLTMFTAGLLVLVGAALLHLGLGRWMATIPVALLGAGVLLVGVFPGPTGTPHALASMLAFVSGGIAGVLVGTVVAPPFRYLSVALGGIALFALVSYMLFGEAGPLGSLGAGGVERWIAYPVVIWLIGFGGYLLGRSSAETA